MPTYHDKATYYRAALLLGLVPGEQVVAWADGVLAQDSAPPHAMFDAALTEPGDLTALRRALEPMSGDSETPAVVYALLDAARRDIELGARSIGDTVTLLAQVRRFLAVPGTTAGEIDAFAEEHMLATAGVGGNLAAIERRVRDWLAPFEGAHDALMRGGPMHVIACERRAEAAAFVAALSRFIASPAMDAASMERGTAEVWAASSADRTQVLLYLNAPALAAAEAAFSPVPVTRTCTRDERPRNAVLVLDARAHRAMGLVEAEQCLAAA